MTTASRPGGAARVGDENDGDTGNLRSDGPRRVRDELQTPRSDMRRRRGLIGRSHGARRPFSRRFEHAPCGRRPDSRSRGSAHRSGTVLGSSPTSRPHRLEVARYHGDLLGGRCPRRPRRSSLTHLSVRSLRCSHAALASTVHQAARIWVRRSMVRPLRVPRACAWPHDLKPEPASRIRISPRKGGLRGSPPRPPPASRLVRRRRSTVMVESRWLRSSIRVSSLWGPSGSSHPRRSARGSGRGCRRLRRVRRRTWSRLRTTASPQPWPTCAGALVPLGSDPRPDGPLTGQRLTIGFMANGPCARSISRARRSRPARSAPRPHRLDDGTTSRVQAVDVASGCAWPIADERDVIRRATIDPAGAFIYEMRVDRVTR